MVSKIIDFLGLHLKTTLANPKTLPITKEVFRSVNLKSQIVIKPNKNQNAEQRGGNLPVQKKVSEAFLQL